MPPKDQNEYIARGKTYTDPLEFMRAIMNDADEDMKMRLDAAKALAPFVHERKGAMGKKASKDAAAKKIAKKFAVAAPPRLVANGK